MNMLHAGLADGALAMTLLRVAAGGFFACSGANKLFNKARHKELVETLKKDNIPLLHFNEWWVPGNEFVGGLMVVAGVATSLFALVLLVICLVACKVEGRQRVGAYKPINRVDQVADWLYLPEVLYGVVLAALVVGGGGAWQLSNLF